MGFFKKQNKAKNTHPKMPCKASFCGDLKYVYCERNNGVIPYYSKEKLSYLPWKWKLSSQKITKIANQVFSLSPPRTPPLSFSWKGLDHLAVPMSDHSILI